MTVREIVCNNTFLSGIESAQSRSKPDWVHLDPAVLLNVKGRRHTPETAKAVGIHPVCLNPQLKLGVNERVSLYLGGNERVLLHDRAKEIVPLHFRVDEGVPLGIRVNERAKERVSLSLRLLLVLSLLVLV